MSNLGGSNKLLSCAVTADMLDVHIDTLYRRWRAWGLKAIRVGRELKFRERDVNDWIERNMAC